MTPDKRTVRYEVVDFSDMKNPSVTHILSQLGGWRPHDPIVLTNRFVILKPKEKGMWN